MYIYMSFSLIFMGFLIFSLFLWSSFYGTSFILEWELFNLNSMEFIYIFMLDKVSLLFMSFVLLISAVVLFYSVSYMSKEVNKLRFFYLVFLFVMSMILMIVSPNLFSILLGWDGLGLISFCLVIYFQNIKSNSAGMVTILSNRIGDGALLMLMGWSMNMGSWNLISFMFLMEKLDYFLIMGSLLMLVGFTKSAQIPFSAWLPAAMAAPTPVSALVHSSTLVTAGVYMLIRFFDLLKISGILGVFLMLGILTMFMSSLSAVVEFDMKKIIALSTLSQLGLMVSTLGLELKYLSFFHLLTHAFFKALMFLCAGLMIHSFYNFQDIRYMGGSVSYTPVTFSCFMVSNFSLMGMFFMSGFYSKDLILEVMSSNYLHSVIYLMFYLSVMLTLIYSIRLIFMVYFNLSNFFVLIEFHDEDFYMVLGMMFLMVLSILSGSILKWSFNFTLKFVYLWKMMKFLILYLMILGVILLMLIMNYYDKLLNYLYLFYYQNYMWFLSGLTVGIFNFWMLKLGYLVLKYLDKGWIEYLFKYTMFNFVKFTMNNLLVSFKSFMKIYLFIFILFIFMIILCY
uniref:NADH-ubiquinone oxidoreductase chain 5 n=1 Tax=Oecetis caucula TaxID=2904905 RepID=A0A9E8LP49_9NEOP|nr:NADH dehydrogenase subunit 5 [Oecetis caucula]UZZ44215.1 NADH dehydrogenase subunit 5 [Oecetis caucula]